MTTYVYRMSEAEANANWITRKYNRALEYIQERNAFFVDRAYQRMYTQERAKFIMYIHFDDLADLRDTERCAQ